MKYIQFYQMHFDSFWNTFYNFLQEWTQQKIILLNKKELVSKKGIWKPAPDNGGPLRVRFQEPNAKLVDWMQSDLVTVERGRSYNTISFVKLLYRFGRYHRQSSAMLRSSMQPWNMIITSIKKKYGGGFDEL